MKRTFIHTAICLVFVAGAIVLLLQADAAHRDYARAHHAADRAIRGATDPATLPNLLPPEPFFRRAQRLSMGVFALAVIALIAAIRTRHFAWIGCFLICGLLAVLAALRTSVYY